MMHTWAATGFPDACQLNPLLAPIAHRSENLVQKGSLAEVGLSDNTTGTAQNTSPLDNTCRRKTTRTRCEQHPSPPSQLRKSRVVSIFFTLLVIADRVDWYESCLGSSGRQFIFKISKLRLGAVLRAHLDAHPHYRLCRGDLISIKKAI